MTAAIARSAVSGDDRYVADYLYRESLATLTEHQQRFLRRTSVLETFSAPLCDAVLDTVDAQGVLRELEASNAFLVPLDRHRGWFRYHALFREFLLGELRRAEPDVITDLHLAAAAWFEEHGSPAMAIEHLLDNSTERTRATKLVAALTLPTYQAGQLTTVQRWFTALGTPAIEAYPPLAVLAGWMTALTGQAREADRWAALLEDRSLRWEARRRLGVVRLRPRDAARDHVRRRAGAARWPTPARRSRRNRPGARGATRPSRCSVRPTCSSASRNRRNSPSWSAPPPRAPGTTPTC